MGYEARIEKTNRAVLAGLQTAEVSDFEHQSSMDELERLVKTLGFITVGRVTQKRPQSAPGTVFGKGKLQELASWTGGSGVVQGFKKSADSGMDDEEEESWDAQREEESIAVGIDLTGEQGKRANLVVFDCELTPTQLSNLEEATGVEVLDRTGVILEIFRRHAKSREARLQVEIAKLAYLAPRLRASHLGSDRQGGGIGSKGAGESAHELDRRRIRDRIAELRSQLNSIRTEQLNRRSRRTEMPLVALIGYTNAGKSSLMRQLTRTPVSGEDKLFATLDTTVRTLQPESTPKILVSDTVGFIKKLPHDLVASFRSTLDEALSASLLIFTVDGSDPNFRSQLQVTKDVIHEIGASEIERLLLINKSDLIDELSRKRIANEYPEAVFLSAHKAEDIKSLREMIISFFEREMLERDIMIPFTKGHLIGKIRQRARVLKEDYDEHGCTLTVRASEEIHQWIGTLL